MGAGEDAGAGGRVRPGLVPAVRGVLQGQECASASRPSTSSWPGCKTCQYVSDLELFHERDFWQHPRVFERLKRGDCEDFALWAWRKLAELGIDAELCVGRMTCDDRPELARQHAWVVYRVNGTAFLFEPAARTPTRMIRPLADVMDEYVPHFAVNHRFDTNAFVGCASDSHRDSLSHGDPTLAV